MTKAQILDLIIRLTADIAELQAAADAMVE